MVAFFWSFPSIPPLGLLSLFLLLLHHPNSAAIAARKPDTPLAFREAPAFRNGETCLSSTHNTTFHVAMTLDSNYLRGTMAAVLSILQHSTCPENVVFHFLWARREAEIFSSIKGTFPYLRYKVYLFDITRVRGLISKSVRQALDQPLTYARIYLADILPQQVNCVIYLDSDLVMVDDIAKLWEVDLKGKVIATPEYCHANLTNYFTAAFWSDPELLRTFEGRKPCYFNTGVMVMDVEKWRNGGYTQKVEDWMVVQKQERIYDMIKSRRR